MMPPVYRAVLRGDQVEWIDRPPPVDGPVEVEIAFPDPEPESACRRRRQRAAAALKQLAASGAFDEIEDPVAWQREIRKDRPLPGRDE
jgi:hypothetical protein